MTGRGAVVRGPLVGAATAWAVRLVCDRLVAEDDPRWSRTNHRGERVSLLEGPAVAAGLLTGSLAAGGRVGVATAVAAVGGATFGLVDDLSEDAARARKGLRGHLGALRHGELTTGGLKVVGIGATSLVAAAVLHGGQSRPGRAGHAVRLLDVLTSGALVAATANLLNLLDLRPGRALKAAGMASAALLVGPGAPTAATTLAVSGTVLGDDLAERDMLGDGGANALGAALGTAAVAAEPRGVRLGLLGAVLGLTLASERLSFTEVIARTPVLREIDAWGRR